jgi:hypothetical protein
LRFNSSIFDIAPMIAGMDGTVTKAGPVADRLSIWPMDDGRYGLDATFQGASGFERAETHVEVLKANGTEHSFRQEFDGGWTLRFGPLTAAEISIALGAFVF